MIQTRSEINGLMQYNSFKAAYQAAKEDNTIWKISFNFPNGERVRLIREGDKFVVALLEDEVRAMMEEHGISLFRVKEWE